MFRVIKLPKVIRTFRLMKIMKLSYFLKNLKLEHHWRFQIKVRENFLKTLYLVLLMFLIVHVASCMFILIGNLDIFYPETWIVLEGLENGSEWRVYLTAIYYCFVVLTTVGYGDIYSKNTIERIFTLVWMLFGIAFYSFTVGFIT